MVERHWIVVGPRDLALAGVTEEFARAHPGGSLPDPAARLRPGDWVACYAPRMSTLDPDDCRRFVAIGRVVEGPDPSRRAVESLASREVSILGLAPRPGFLRNKDKWNAAFRFGMIRITSADFETIRGAMLGASAGEIDSASRNGVSKF